MSAACLIVARDDHYDTGPAAEGNRRHNVAKGLVDEARSIAPDGDPILITDTWGHMPAANLARLRLIEPQLVPRERVSIGE